MKRLWTSITGARDWLTLLAVAAAAAWLWSQFATIRKDRDQLLGFAEVACAAAGSSFAASTIEVADAKGKVKPAKAARGVLCQGRIRTLAAYERETTTQSAEILAGALTEHNRKTAADADLASRAAAQARAAAANMEKADASIAEDDRVDGRWFGALNNLAGLRAPDRR